MFILLSVAWNKQTNKKAIKYQAKCSYHNRLHQLNNEKLKQKLNALDLFQKTEINKKKQLLDVEIVKAFSLDMRII